MSWDVLIMKMDSKTPLRDLPHDFQPECLGQTEELRLAIAKVLGPLDWSDPAWGIFCGDGFSIEFNFTKSGPLNSFMLHVRGGGDAVAPIVAMCRHFGWQAFDCSTGDLIDIENPLTESWEHFQAYRDRIVAEARVREGHSGSAANT